MTSRLDLSLSTLDTHVVYFYSSFGCHLFYDLFVQGWGGHGPLGTPPGSATESPSLHPLPLLLIFHFIVFHFSFSSSIPSFSLCLLYSSSLLFFPVLSSSSYLSLIFLFIILFFGNPLKLCLHLPSFSPFY